MPPCVPSAGQLHQSQDKLYASMNTPQTTPCTVQPAAALRAAAGAAGLHGHRVSTRCILLCWLMEHSGGPAQQKLAGASQDKPC